MILSQRSPSHRNLTAFFCYISMCSIFFFSFCSSHKSSQCKHSQGHFATVQGWKFLSIYLWSGHQITKWIDTLCFTTSSLYIMWRFSLLNGMRYSTFLFQHFTFSNSIFTGFYKVESKDKCLRALSADCEMNFPSPSPADVHHPEWWSDSINRDRNFSFTVSESNFSSACTAVCYGNAELLQGMMDSPAVRN